MSIRTLRILQLAFALPTYVLMVYSPLTAVPFAFAYGATCAHLDLLKNGSASIRQRGGEDG